MEYNYQTTSEEHQRWYTSKRLWIILSVVLFVFMISLSFLIKKSPSPPTSTPLQSSPNIIPQLKKQAVLEIHIGYSTSKKQFNITSVIGKEAFAPRVLAKSGTHILEVVSNDNKTISSLVFNAPPARYHDDLRHVLMPAPENQSLVFTVSVNDEADSIRITDIKTNQKIEQKISEIISYSFVSQDVFNYLIPQVMAEAANKVHITFINDKYPLNASGEQQFKNDARKLYDVLMTIEPFKSRSRQFELHTIWSTESRDCYFPHENSALVFCDIDKALSVANDSGIPYDSLTILINSDTYHGAGFLHLTPGVSMTTNSKDANYIFPHEFAHAFGKLTDEYLYKEKESDMTDSDIKERDDLPSVYHNCYKGVPPAPGWNIPLSDYKDGCMWPGVYRSSEDSTMRSSGVLYFNIVSQKLLSDEINRLVGDYIPPEEPTPTPTTEVTVLIPSPTPVYTTEGGDNQCSYWSFSGGFSPPPGYGDNCLRSACPEDLNNEELWKCVATHTKNWPSSAQPNPWPKTHPRPSTIPQPSSDASPSQPSTEPAKPSQVPATPVVTLAQPTAPIVNACGESPMKGYSGACGVGNYTCVFEECGCSSVNACIDQYSNKWGSNAWVGRCCGVRK